MSWNTILDAFLSVAGFGLSLTAMAVAIVRTRRAKVDERFKATEDRLLKGSSRMGKQDERMAALEQTVAGLPAKEDLHRIELNIAAMTGAMSELKAVMEGNAKIMGRIEDVVTRHEEYLRNKG